MQNKTFFLILAALAAFIVINDIRHYEPDSELIGNTTQARFEKDIQSDTGYVLIDFWAPWCAPCYTVKPIINDLAEAYSQQLKVYKLNFDMAGKILNDYKIEGIPCVILFKDGKEIDRLLMARPEKEYREMLHKHAVAPNPS